MKQTTISKGILNKIYSIYFLPFITFMNFCLVSLIALEMVNGISFGYEFTVAYNKFNEAYLEIIVLTLLSIGNLILYKKVMTNEVKINEA